jgi:hypothetical protein
MSAGQIQPVQQARDVPGHLLDRIRARGLARPAVPRLSTAITWNRCDSGPVSLPILDTSRPKPPGNTSGTPEPCDS